MSQKCPHDIETFGYDIGSDHRNRMRCCRSSKAVVIVPLRYVLLNDERH